MLTLWANAAKSRRVVQLENVEAREVEAWIRDSELAWHRQTRRKPRKPATTIKRRGRQIPRRTQRQRLIRPERHNKWSTRIGTRRRAIRRHTRRMHRKCPPDVVNKIVRGDLAVQVIETDKPHRRRGGRRVRDRRPLGDTEILRAVQQHGRWIQQQNETVEEWTACTGGGFVRTTTHITTEPTAINHAYIGREFDSTRGYPGEGPAQGTPVADKDDTVKCMALNMNGMGKLDRREVAATPEAGRTMSIIASTKVTEVLQIMEAGNIQLAALADTSLDEEATEDAKQLFKEMGYECYATPGSLNNTRVKRGVMLVWDPTTCGKCDLSTGDKPKTIVAERVVKARFKFLRDDRKITVYGVYMPVRYGNMNSDIDEAWDALIADVTQETDDGHEVMIGGDFNAETPAWRSQRTAGPGTRADERMAELIEEATLMPQAQSATYRTGSQIDNWLVSEGIDACTRRADTLPGVGGRDHMAVILNYCADVDPNGERIERPINSVATKLAQDMRQEPKDKQGELLAAFKAAATELWTEAKSGWHQNTTEPQKLRDMQRVLMQAANMTRADNQETATETAPEDCEQTHGVTARKGKPAIPPRELARWRVAKWIRHVGEAQRWAGGYLRDKWYGHGMWNEPTIASDPNLCRDPKDSAMNHKQRRERLNELCETKRHEAQCDFEATNAPEGDQLLARMQESTTKNMGSCIHDLFNLIKEYTGKQARKPSKLMSMYPDDDETSPDLVRGPAIKTEVHKVATKINAKRVVNMSTVKELLEWIHEFPVEDIQTPIEDRVCSREQLRAAIRYAKAAKGLGIDGFDAYTLKWLTEEMFEDYHHIMRHMIRCRDFPHEWNSWIALLALKPDEDPKKLGRRRDLWLQCHNAKITERLLMAEYDHASWNRGPASQAGFEKERNAPEQTMALRLKTEEAMTERKMLCRGYVDLGTFFMSCCHEVQTMVETWSGVPHDTRGVMAALREGVEAQGMPSLTGQYETAYGLTDPVEIRQGLGQGSLLSPVRAKLMLSVIQYALKKLCPGSQMTMDGRRLVSLWYADDGCVVCDDLPSLQLAMECIWLTTKMLGLLWQVKGKKKTAWSATWWKDGVERDVTGYEMRMPDDSLIPQLVGEEIYKYLGTEMSTGWNNGKAHMPARTKVVAKCRQLIGLLGRVPCLTEQQFGNAVSLALSGCIGYYARSTVITWEDCVKIEHARVAALQAKGVTEGVPRRQIYGSPTHAEMGHEHAYVIAAAALRDQIDRALCGREGEPARAVVEEAIAKTCYRLGCRTHPLEWQPTHLVHELRDDLIIEAYLKGMIQCGWRGRLTQGGEQLHGPLGQEAGWEWTDQQKHEHGPMLWENSQTDVWDSQTTVCTYSRELARRGITHWAHITNIDKLTWLSTKEAKAIYNLQAGRETRDYESMIATLNNQQNATQRSRWFEQVKNGEAQACSAPATDEGTNKEERLRTGYWEIDRVIAARRTAVCFGGYEYAIKWTDGSMSWTKHSEMRTDTQTTKAMEAARTHSMKPADFHSWLNEVRQTAKVKDAKATCAHQSNRHGWGGVWKLFQQYRETSEVRGLAVHTRAEENLPETPATHGVRGKQWQPDSFRTCYLGRTERVGNQAVKRCSLHPYGDLNAQLSVKEDIIASRQAEEWNIMRDTVAREPVRPPALSDTSTRITEIDRILRANSAFGILGCPADLSMGNAQIGEWFTSALGRLNAAAETAPGTKRRAEAKLDNARATLMDPALRQKAYDAYRRHIDLVTCTLRCPVDVAALEAFAATNDAEELYDNISYRTRIQAYLRLVTRDENANEGHVMIRYRHSDLAQTLIDAGMISISRAYAHKNDHDKDPFCLPKVLRKLAIGRFGQDFDDGAAHPRAQLNLVPLGREQAEFFLAHREEILAKSGAILFPNATPGVRRQEAKAAFSSFSMDGSWQQFLARTYKPCQIVPIIDPNDLTFTIWGGSRPGCDPLTLPTFNLKEYLQSQQASTTWIQDKLETTIGAASLVKAWLAIHKPHKRHPERTLKSYVYQEHESISRQTKEAWCEQNGHATLNLQHDGMIIALREGVTAEMARRELQRASEEALGMQQPVEIKPIKNLDGTTIVAQTKEDTETQLEYVGCMRARETVDPPHADSLSKGIASNGIHTRIAWENTTAPPTTFERARLWRGRAYDIVRNRTLQLDPVARLFLRSQRLEQGGSISTRTGSHITMDKHERTLQTDDNSVQSSTDAIRTLMKLHIAHQFTHSAAVDGSKEGHEPDEISPGRAATAPNEDQYGREDRLARTAYGIWEGLKPIGYRPEGSEDVVATDDTIDKSIADNLWGGRLPDSFAIADAEMYACYKFLLKVWTRAETPANRAACRVLICSDCKPALMQIEHAWRQGHATGFRKYDRGNLLEAICNLRADMGRVIMVWTPAHAGITPNAMADCVAKHYTHAEHKEDPVTHIAPHVLTRPCTYERRIHTQNGDSTHEVWEHADRRPFSETKRQMTIYVRKRLSEGLKEGCTTAGVTGKLWSAVVRSVDVKLHTDLRKQSRRMGAPSNEQPTTNRGDDEPRPDKLQPEDVLAHNVRRSMVLGMRVDNVFGIPHGRGWARRRKGEAHKGGPATTSEVWGCWACKRATDLEARQRDDLDQNVKTKAQQQEEWTHEAQRQLDTKATLRHIMCGECKGMTPEVLKACRHRDQIATHAVRKATQACIEHKREQQNSANGNRVTATLQGALVAAQRTHAQRAVSTQQWQNRWAVLAGVLPAWAEGDEEDKKGPEKECAAALNESVDAATHTITKWHQCAKAGHIFMSARDQNKGLMQMTFRAWREQVELTAPQIHNVPTKWKVRTTTNQPTTTRIARDDPDTDWGDRECEDPSPEKALAHTKRDDWCDVPQAAYNWNPWGTRQCADDNSQAPQDDDDTRAYGPLTQQACRAEQRWKLRDKCLRVATYYRVMHLRHTARRREHMQTMQRKFAAWALSFIRHIKHQERLTAHNVMASRERTSRQDLVSASTRMQMRPTDLYRETRRNNARQPLQRPTRRTRLTTMTTAEIGSLIYTSMCTAASRFRMWLSRDAG